MTKLLSDEQAQEIFKSEHCNISKDLAGILYRAIEAAVLEAQGKQEPVGVFDVYGDSYIQIKPEHADEISVHLYAAPVVQPETKDAEYWRRCHEKAEATNVALRKQIAELIASAPVVQPGMVKLREHVAWCMKGSASLVEKAFNEVPGQGEVSLQVALGEKLQWWMRTAELIAAAEEKE